MSKSGFGQMYRRLSSKLLDLVVTPHVLGEIPSDVAADSQSPQQENKKVVCYVLQNYSRSNALVVDGETRRLHLKPALDAMSFGNYQEKNSVLFLHQNENKKTCSINCNYIIQKQTLNDNAVKAGKISASKQIRRSKNEKELFNLLSNKFKCLNWHNITLNVYRPVFSEVVNQNESIIQTVL